MPRKAYIDLCVEDPLPFNLSLGPPPYVGQKFCKTGGTPEIHSVFTLLVRGLPPISIDLCKTLRKTETANWAGAAAGEPQHHAARVHRADEHLERNSLAAAAAAADKW